MALRRRLRIESLESRRMLTAVDIPNDLSGEILDQVTAPLNIDDAAEIRGAEIRVAYDTNVLDITEAGIVAGSVWSGDATVNIVASVDEAAGTIVVSIFGANSLPAISGSLVDFQFTIRADATVGTTTVIDVTEVRLNEGAITLDTVPQPGADATDGLITISATAPNQDATVSGTVYADTNNNHQVDAGEGIPGVTITLVNTVTNVQRQTTTLANGQYQFANVEPGAYEIQQEQPAAYVDGGGNTIPVTLSSNQTLTGQDFREIGLRPEFIYNRLFTTLVMPIGSANWSAAITQINADAASGIVNPLVTTTVTSSAQGEGEAGVVVTPQTEPAPVAATLDSAAEGEGDALRSAEGESAVIGSQRLNDASFEVTPVTTTTTSFVLQPPIQVGSLGPRSTTSGSHGTGADTIDDVSDLVDSYWTEAEVLSAASLVNEPSVTTARDDKQVELKDSAELLAIDEVFAITEDW